MKELAVTLTAIILLLLIGGIYLPYQKQQALVQKGLVLFYSDTCPHCKEVDHYLVKNDINSKFNLIRKEVTAKENLALFIHVNQECHLYYEIPLLWDGRQCYVGINPIVQYFNQRIAKGNS